MTLLSRRSLVTLLPLAPLAAAAPGDFAYTRLAGLGPEPGLCRRDPSDVIHVDGLYYVWYTKVRKGPGIYSYPSGYSGDLWYATSPDGRRWTERGEALHKGPPGAFDEFGIFTPGILAAAGRYYLFYTAVRPPMSEQTPTAIGLAVAASPRGPWRRHHANPVLMPTTDPALFDSFRVDDACALVRNGEYWLYYKGRQAGLTPRETRWGLAVAHQPEGPYLRRQPEPVLGSGHEVLVWPEGAGIAALVGPTGPEKNTLQYAADGVHFHPVRSIADPPRAPGGFRPDAFTGARPARGMRWGISMTTGPDPYLVRFDMRVSLGQSAE